jgi:hypothetical protein
MHNEHSNPSASTEGQLAARLKLEAFAERPAFSDALHARILRAIETPGGQATIERTTSRRSSASWIAIAAGLLVAALGVMQLGGPSNIPAPLFPRDNAPNGVAVVESVGDKVSLDDLDRGTVAAVRLVVDQLPIEVPTVDWGAALAD